MTDRELVKSKVTRRSKAKRFAGAMMLCAGLLGSSMASPANAAAADYITPVITVGGGVAADVLEEVLEDALADKSDMRLRTSTPVRISGSGQDIKVRIMAQYKKLGVWWDVELKVNLGVSCWAGTSGRLSINMKDVQLVIDSGVLGSVIPGLQIAFNRLANEIEPDVEQMLAKDIKTIYLNSHPKLLPQCPGIKAGSNGSVTLDYRRGTQCTTSRTGTCPPNQVGSVRFTCENGRYYVTSTCTPTGGGGGPGNGEIP